MCLIALEKINLFQNNSAGNSELLVSFGGKEKCPHERLTPLAKFSDPPLGRYFRFDKKVSLETYSM